MTRLGLGKSRAAKSREKDGHSGGGLARITSMLPAQAQTDPT